MGKRRKNLLAIVIAVLMAFSMTPEFVCGGTDAPDNPAGTEGSAAVPDEPKNGIPLIIINVEEKELYTDNSGNQYGTIDDMNGSLDHSIRCKGSVDIMVPDGYQGMYGADTAPQGSLKLSYIRGRGNSTWQIYSKKPYKLKFDKKQNLFGMGKNKEWALLANAADPTLMRNQITSWLGEQMGMPFTPKMIPVDVVMKGSGGSVSYLGNYYLAELVDVGESRVEISELDSDTETEAEADNPNITGGYLISMYGDMQDDEPFNSIFRTNAGVEFFTRVPSYEGDEESVLTEGERKQREYIRDYFQDLENLILQPDEIDGTTHEKIAERMDLESLADYWLIQEFSKNGDAFCTSSTYLFKDRNGKLCWGPLWDFDLAWGGGLMDASESLEDYSPDIGSFNSTDMNWIDALREKDPQFAEILNRRWKLMDQKLTELTEEGGVIDQFRLEIQESQKDNAGLWQNEMNTAKNSEEYDLVVRKLKKWIDGRHQWFSDHLDRMNNALVDITYKVDGVIIETETVRADTREFLPPDVPEKDGMYFAGWFTEGTHEPMDGYLAADDTVFAAEYQEACFLDVRDPDKYYYKPVYWAVQNAITKGTSDEIFSPDDVCKRSEAVTFLWRAFGSPEPASLQLPFKDVKAGGYYEKAVAWAVENNITNGVSADKFGPDMQVTRGQTVTFLYRLDHPKEDPDSSGEPGNDTPSDNPDDNGDASCDTPSDNPDDTPVDLPGDDGGSEQEISFTDVAKGDFYYDSVYWAAENMITNGTTPTTFEPGAVCTRGQIVTFLYRYMEEVS